jgi:3'-phosphoadenosine 5'-phosphosulfate sulfotransferase (PAPS reductase)/FAD synthetase
MAAATNQQIRDSLRQLYVEDPRPRLVGFSGGKDSTLVAALVFDAVISVPPEQRTKPVTVLCTDTRVDGNSHKKAQRSQRTGGANLFSLSASNEIPRAWERERMPAGQVRVEGENPINAERAGVRCRIRSLPGNNARQNATRDTDRMQRRIQNYRRTRDLLLPRLLSGQVELETERNNKI